MPVKHEIVAEVELEAFAEAQSKKPASKPDGGPKPFIWIGGVELTRMEPRLRQMIVENILPAGGLTINSSKAKSGKTTLMVEICHAVATGRPALGHYEVKAGPVL